MRAITGTLRPRRHSAQQCRHQHRSAAARRAAERKTLGGDAGGKSPHHRGQRRRRISDDAGRVAGAHVTTLGPNHQRDDKSRQRCIAAGYSHMAVRKRRTKRCSRLAQELEGTGVTAKCSCAAAPPTRAWFRACRTGSFDADRAGGDGRAAGLAVLERLRWRQRSTFHRREMGCESAARTGGEDRCGARGLATARPAVDQSRWPAVAIMGLPERGLSRHWRKLRR